VKVGLSILTRGLSFQASALLRRIFLYSNRSYYLKGSGKEEQKVFKNSIQIGSLWGIPLKIHYSFLIILPFLAWAFGNNIQLLAEMVEIPLTSLHSIVARGKGVKIHSINLMLFGGVAQMDHIPEDPRDEAMIAFAGPMLSLVLGGLLIGGTAILGGVLVADIQLLFMYLGWLNLFLAVFNMIPAFPTDGGRVLRALLARKMSFLKATKIAANIGKVFAFFLGILGLLTVNFIMIFVAFFIYIAASQEYQTIFIKNTLADFSVSDLMTHDVRVVDEDTLVSELLDRMFVERHSGYPVVSNGEVTGCVTMGDVRKIDPERHSQTRVREIMSRDIVKVDPDEDIFIALRKLSQDDLGRLMVMREDQLVGIITRTDIMKGFRLREMQEQG